MTEKIRNYIDQIQIGAEQSYKNLSVYPVISDYVIPFDYLTLDEALSEELIEVVEIDKDGTVPELKVVNKSDRMILIFDGEELVGAKQNRIVNTTILIPANETVVIPVSCVEQGRWSYDTEKFYSQKRELSPKMRAMKAENVTFSLQTSGKFLSDQGAIWSEISEKAGRMDAESPSMAMAEIYRKSESDIQNYVKHFSPVDSQIGAIFMINGQVVGMDCFGKTETFSGVFKKLVESYALDSIDWYEAKKKFNTDKSNATNFIKTAKGVQTKKHPSVGLGTDCRLESNECNGFALEFEDRILHLSIFAQDAGNNKATPSPRMQRFSRRRNYRL